jgi:hypothetical protein
MERCFILEEAASTPSVGKTIQRRALDGGDLALDNAEHCQAGRTLSVHVAFGGKFCIGEAASTLSVGKTVQQSALDGEGSGVDKLWINESLFHRFII